jgi:hypothetical protein
MLNLLLLLLLLRRRRWMLFWRSALVYDFGILNLCSTPCAEVSLTPAPPPPPQQQQQQQQQQDARPPSQPHRLSKGAHIVVWWFRRARSRP